MKNPSFLLVASGRNLLTAAIATLLLNQQALAGNTWDGGGGNGLWNNAANWNPDGVAVAGNLVFAGTTQLATNNNLFAAGTLQTGITFNAGAGSFTLSGNSIGLNGDINTSATTAQTINLDLILTGGNRNVNANVAGSSVVISGAVSQDATARRLQATGLGTVTLNGTTAHTFTGGLSASGNGTMIVDLSNIAGNTNLVATTNNPNLGNGNAAAQGTIIIRGSATGTSSQTLSGLTIATGTSGLFVVDANGGSGTNVNLGTAVNRNSGSTVTFDITSSGSSLTGTTLSLGAGTQTANQAIRGYALVKDAAGTGFATNVGGSLVRYTGASALTAGGTGLTTTAANNYSLAAGGTTTSLAGAQTVNSLHIDTTGSAGVLDLGTGTTTVSSGGLLFTGNAAATIQGGQLGATASEVIVHALGTGGVTIGSNISGGAGSFTKSGSDTVTISGNNTYTGATNVVAGILRAGSATAFSANSEFNIANSIGAGLQLNGFDVNIGALKGGGTVGGGIALGANTLTVGGKGTAFDYSGAISGTGGVTKVGAGLFQVFGANTYTGATNISEGTMRARNGTAFGVGSAVTVASGATMDLWQNNLTIGSLSGGGSVTNGSGGATLTTGSDNTSTTFSGVISNGTGFGLTKTGTGTQTLSGNNTYTGATNVNGGVLKSGAGTTTAFGVNSATTLANTAGAALDLTSASASVGSLAGGGTTGGNVILGANRLTVGGLNTNTAFSGIISGTGGGLDKIGTGILTLNGANTYTGNTTIAAGGGLTLGTTGVLNFAIGASGVNTAISGSGNLVLNGTFNFDLALAATSGTWNLVDAANLNETYGGTFNVANFTQSGTDWTRVVNDTTYTYSQTTGVLTAVVIPEPSALLLLGAGVLGLGFRRNRRD